LIKIDDFRQKKKKIKRPGKSNGLSLSIPSCPEPFSVIWQVEFFMETNH